jgi:autotransporter-associated beta strand protein
VRMLTDRHTYTGATHIRGGTVELARGGKLDATSAIVLYEDQQYWDGTLHLVSDGAGNLTDRVADSIPFFMRGGALRWSATEGLQTSETLGAMTFVEGESLIESPSSAPYCAPGTNSLTIASIEREPGATAQFNIGPSAKILVGEAPELVGGILPWLLTVDHRSSSNRVTGFATYANGEIALAPATSGDLDVAAPDANLFASGGGTITADRRVNSLASNGSTFNLAGHRLTVDSGGVYRASFTGGELTAGAAGGHELILHGSTVSANIVDDGANPVSVTIFGSANFSGNNSYSGTTYVNEGGLYLGSEGALPSESDLQIVGGQVHVGYTSTTAKHLDTIRIAGKGALTNSFTGIRGDANFSFDEAILEDGLLSPGRLSGGGVIFKRTPGVAQVIGGGGDFHGDVYVEEGLLKVSSLPQAKFTVTGGTLQLPTGANPVTLDGGAFNSPRHTGVITVVSPSRIQSNSDWEPLPYELAGSFVGDGDLTFENAPFWDDSRSIASQTGSITGHSPLYFGNVEIRTAAISLRYADGLGSGRIAVRSGGRLTLGGITLPNEIVLDGGELAGNRDTSATLTGAVRVEGKSFAGSSLRFTGDVTLADGAELATLSGYEMHLLGDTNVAGEATLHVTRVVNEGDFSDDVIRLGGRVIAAAPISVLNIYDSGLDEFVFDASFHVDAGRSLQIVKNGVAPEITLDAGTGLTGNGTFLNPIHVNGGVLAPGDSPGELTFADDLLLGPGSIYQWEINDAAGQPGAAEGWDHLQIDEELILAATPAAPVIIRVLGLNELGLPGPVANFNPAGTYQWAIASAASIVDFDPVSVRIEIDAAAVGNPALRPENLSLSVVGSQLYLSYEFLVPEPSTFILCTALAGAIAARRRKSTTPGFGING